MPPEEQEQLQQQATVVVGSNNSNDSSSGVGGEFTVMIIASGPLRNGGAVHAVAVQQPLQSWTVLRSHDDFYAVSEVLSQLLPDVPICPVIADHHNHSCGDHDDGTQDATASSDDDLVAVVNARNELQKWLSAVLTHPGSTETLAVRNFLTYGANVVLPQFEGVAWTSFDADGAVLPTTAAASTNANSTTAARSVRTNSSGGGHVGGGGDMEMEDMFFGEEEGGGAERERGEFDAEEDYFRPSVRYKPTNEAISEEDEMDMMQLANEVEMIEDIGSLAQSLGASHLGRSLQLQKEIAFRDHHPTNNSEFGNNSLFSSDLATSQGVNVGGGGLGSAFAFGTAAAGGMGAVMESAATTSDGMGEGLISKPPESPPRLDSFKMIKVIGKGSFGKHAHDVISFMWSRLHETIIY